MRKYNQVILATILFMAILTLVIALADIHVEFNRELLQALMIVVGMLMTATVSFILRHLDGLPVTPLIQISFNESKTRAVLDEAINADYQDVVGGQKKSESWDLSEEELLDQDPTLALAKLRIDIERELRKIAFNSGIDVDARSTSIGFLISMLTKRGLLGPAVASAINDVLPACNEAIHGGQVTLQVARSVLGVGKDLVTLLRSYRSFAATESVK